MGVSRPTFTRIYASALRKIAKAFVEGKQISIEGGKVYFDSDWFQCVTCKCYFNNPEKEEKPETCPLCGSANILPCENMLTDDEYSNSGYTHACSSNDKIRLI
jgi:Zn finger protein HypA/HybF involved in hydrogenase expression